MYAFRSHTALIISLFVVVGLFNFQTQAHAAMEEVLGCTFEPDGGGDLADMRGIRFTLQDDFQALELYMSSFNPDVYIFTAELRRSSGFTGTPLRTVRTSVAFTGVNEPKLVHLDFSEIQVSGSETFTLRFDDFYGPETGNVYFETINDTDFCPQVEETTGNTGSNPQVRFNDPWPRVLGPGQPSALSLASTYVTTPPTLTVSSISASGPCKTDWNLTADTSRSFMTLTGYTFC